MENENDVEVKKEDGQGNADYIEALKEIKKTQFQKATTTPSGPRTRSSLTRSWKAVSSPIPQERRKRLTRISSGKNCTAKALTLTI